MSIRAMFFSGIKFLPFSKDKLKPGDWFKFNWNEAISISPDDIGNGIKMHLEIYADQTIAGDLGSGYADITITPDNLTYSGQSQKWIGIVNSSSGNYKFCAEISTDNKLKFIPNDHGNQHDFVTCFAVITDVILQNGGVIDTLLSHIYQGFRAFIGKAVHAL